MLKKFLLGATFCVGVAVTVEGQEAVKGGSDEARKVEAAKAFARQLASEGTEDFARAFRYALEAGDRFRVSPAATTRSLAPVRGGVEADERYRRNLDAMLQSPGEKIWGGRRVPPRSFPDAVAVRGALGGLCTGTLITETVVLTAAHCPCGGVRKQVVFGDSIDAPIDTIDIVRTELFIPCTQPPREGDLALLFLQRPARVPPRRLARGEWIDKATDVRAVGFGRTEVAQIEPAGIKRLVDVPIASSDCNGQVQTGSGDIADSVYYDCRAKSELVAGAPLLDRDSCNGDSGGPIYIRGVDQQYYLAGATSRAVFRPGLRPCGDGGIYARVDGEALAWMRRLGVTVAVASVGAQATTVAVLAASAAADAGAGQQRVSDRTKQYVGKLQPGTVLSGKVQVRTDGSKYLELDSNRELKLPVTNPGQVPSAARGLPAKMVVEPDVGGVRVTGLVLEVVSQLAHQLARLPQTKFEQLHIAVRRIETAALDVLKPGAMTATREALGEEARRTQNEYVRAYARLKPEDAEEREAIVRGFKALVITTKAIYFRNDLYPPETYDRIYKTSRSAAAIGRTDEAESRSSGVLIGRDLVLTCLHCIEGALLTDLVVRFNYERDLAGNQLPADAYPIVRLLARGGPVNAGGPDLDFALLLLRKNAHGRSAGEQWPIQCLSEGDVDRDDPLYVIGYPEGRPRIVHDNAFVYFPFRVTVFGFNRLKLLVEAEFQDAPDRAPRVGEFLKSYRKATFRGQDVYENYSLRWGAQPTIGADSDTYHGNSGSPVYKKRNQKLVGLLFAGEPDISVSLTPGWRSHEAILPLSKIVEQLDQRLGGWRRLDGVCTQ